MHNIGEENEQVEFKKSTGELKEGVIAIASILNKHGAGELYFGVKNNGDVIGQEISDKTIAYVRFEGNRAPYLAYHIPRIRVADEDKVMDKQDLLAEDGIHLLNAGAVLFCESSMNDVQMAKFATDVKATFTDIRREDRGSIIGLSRVCEQYIIDAMDWKADIVGLKRVETPEIPVEAVREAIINSYGHRLYNNYQCNEIDVFKNRIEIHTTGGFPEGHTPEEFLDGNRKAIRRNKLITGVLYYSDDMETFATGLKRIKDLCDEAGCKVEFRTEVDDFVVVFYRNLREEWNSSDHSAKSHGNKTTINNSTQNERSLKQEAENETSLKQALKQVLKKTDYKKLLSVIEYLEQHSEITIQDAMDLTGKSRTTAWRYLQILSEAKIIESTGNTNNVSYVKIFEG